MEHTVGLVGGRRRGGGVGGRPPPAAWGLRLCATEPRFYSDTVSAIHVPDGFDSGAVVRVAYERYNLSLGLGLAEVAGKVFRIGHLGDLNEIMVLAALAGTEMVLRDCGIAIEPGRGVAAAQESLRASHPAARRAEPQRKSA